MATRNGDGRAVYERRPATRTAAWHERLYHSMDDVLSGNVPGIIHRWGWGLTVHARCCGSSLLMQTGIATRSVSTWTLGTVPSWKVAQVPGLSCGGM
jgi:hypothetical protein